MTNVQILQQAVLLKFKSFYAFLREHAPADRFRLVAEEEAGALARDPKLLHTVTDLVNQHYPRVPGGPGGAGEAGPARWGADDVLDALGQGGDGGGDGAFWFLDPIDGTRGFVRYIPAPPRALPNRGTRPLVHAVRFDFCRRCMPFVFCRRCVRFVFCAGAFVLFLAAVRAFCFLPALRAFCFLPAVRAFCFLLAVRAFCFLLAVRAFCFLPAVRAFSFLPQVRLFCFWRRCGPSPHPHPRIHHRSIRPETRLHPTSSPPALDIPQIVACLVPPFPSPQCS
jgi:hypothetical protein